MGGKSGNKKKKPSPSQAAKAAEKNATPPSAEQPAVNPEKVSLLKKQTVTSIIAT